MPLQILLSKHISLLLFDSNIDLLRVSFQRTFKHDARTYSYIICAYFTFVYIYFYKNGTMHIFGTATTPLLCFVFTSEAAEQRGCVPSSRAGPELQLCLQAQGLLWPCQVPSLLHLTLPNYRSSDSTLPPWHYFVRVDFKTNKKPHTPNKNNPTKPKTNYETLKSKYHYLENIRSLLQLPGFYKYTQKVISQTFSGLILFFRFLKFH